MDIKSVSNTQIDLLQQETTLKKGNTEITQRSTSISIASTEAAVYDPSNNVLTDKGYKVDMDKVKAMKAETEQHMVDSFREAVKGGFGKQIKGIKRFIEVFQNKDGQVSALTLDGDESDMDISDEGVVQAQKDVAEDGYWGAKAVSDRFLDFAKALSGGDASKADLLLDAVKEGYKMAEEIWGSELPQLSKDTLALTIEKFDAWRDGLEVVSTIQEET